MDLGGWNGVLGGTKGREIQARVHLRFLNLNSKNFIPWRVEL
jgi:hypothetical protein